MTTNACMDGMLCAVTYVDMFLVNPSSMILVDGSGATLSCGSCVPPKDELTQSLSLVYDVKTQSFSFPVPPYPSVLVYIRVGIPNAAPGAIFTVGTTDMSIQACRAETQPLKTLQAASPSCRDGA
jgi:hypothetical protein